MSIEWQAGVVSDTVVPSEMLVTEIVKSSFAKDWFDDAYNEVTKEASDLFAVVAARRREIIFAVCTIESYFF